MRRKSRMWGVDCCFRLKDMDVGTLIVQSRLRFVGRGSTIKTSQGRVTIMLCWFAGPLLSNKRILLSVDIVHSHERYGDF